MRYNDDPMLAELRQIKIRLWEKSGYDLHNMAKMMKQETDETMVRYGKPADTDDLSQFCGKWQDDRDAEEIVSQIYADRAKNIRSEQAVL